MTESEAKFNHAKELFDQKKYLHSIQILQKLLDDPLLGRQAVILLIEIYDLQNQTEAAIKLFEEYLSNNSDDDNLRTYFAQFLVRKEKFAEAHDYLSAVSSTVQPLKNLIMGMVNYYLEDYEVARVNFLEYITQNPNSEYLPDAFLNLAKTLLKLDLLDDAISYSNKVLEIDIKNVEAYFTLAKVYYTKEMYFHARENIRSAIKMNPNQFDFYKLSAKIFFKLGEYKFACNDLSFYMKHLTPTSEDYTFMGILLVKMNKMLEALGNFNSALELDSSNKIALRYKAECNKEK